MVNLAHRLAFASSQITAAAVAAVEYPDLVRQYRVTGVPKTVVNEDTEILGAIPEADFVSQVLAGTNDPEPLA